MRTNCVVLDTYDVLTDQTNRIAIPRCITQNVAIHANSNYLAVGDEAENSVYVYKKLSNGTFIQEDSLEFNNYDESSTDSGGRFGRSVYVDASGDIYAFAPYESMNTNGDGSLRRFKRITTKATATSVDRK
jgi:hypothetical protein